MARVLLVNPPIYDFAAFDLWARPLGLLYIAAVLERHGHEVRIVDSLDRFHPSAARFAGRHAAKSRRHGTGRYCWREAPRPPALRDVPRIYKRFGIPADDLRRELAAGLAPDVVGVTSGMTYWYPGVAEAVRAVREVFPAAPVVLGGIYATLCAEHARRVIRPDHLVTGAGEAEMARIVAAVAGAAPPAGEIAFGEMPEPAYHLLEHVESVSVLTAKGCPFHCDYCAVHALAPKIERRAAAAVADEIERYVRRFGVGDVAFFDDALLWEARRHAKPLLREIIDRRIGVRFHAPNGLHARFVDEEIAGLMRSAGFVTVRLSLETAAPQRLAGWDNKVSYEEFLTAAGNLKAAGFTADEIGAYVMVGVPGEGFDQAATDIAAAHSAGVQVRLALYSPTPTTAFFEEAARASPYDLADPLLQNNTIVPAGGLGSYGAYQRLKDFARELNRELENGRIVFSRREVERGIAGESFKTA